MCAYARYLGARRLLLIGRIDEAERTLAELDPEPFPPASRIVHELVVAGIAVRRLRTKGPRAALAWTQRAARHARIPTSLEVSKENSPRNPGTHSLKRWVSLTGGVSLALRRNSKLSA